MEENIKIKVQMEQDEASFNEVVDGMRKKIKEIYAPADRIREENELKRLDKRFGLDKGPSRDDLRREKDERKRAQQEEIEHVKNLGRERQKAEKELAALKKRDLEEQTEMSKRALQDGQKNLNDKTTAYQAAAGGMPQSFFQAMKNNITGGFGGGAGAALGASAVLRFGGDALNSYNQYGLVESGLAARSASAKDYFSLQQASGDFSGQFFKGERAKGIASAPSKAGMVGTDLAYAAADVAKIAAGALMIGGSGGAGTVVGGAIAGQGAYSLFNKAKNLPNYFNSLEAEYQEKNLQTQLNEINRDPFNKKGVEQMLQSGASTSGIYNSKAMAGNLMRKGISNAGTVIGTLEQGMYSGSAEKAAIQIFGEAFKVAGIGEMTREIKILSEGMSARMEGAGIRSDYAGSGSSEFAALMASGIGGTSMADVKGGLSAFDAMNQLSGNKNILESSIFYSEANKNLRGSGIKNIDSDIMGSLGNRTVGELNLGNPYVSDALNELQRQNPTTPMDQPSLLKKLRQSSITSISGSSYADKILEEYKALDPNSEAGKAKSQQYLRAYESSTEKGQAMIKGLTSPEAKDSFARFMANKELAPQKEEELLKQIDQVQKNMGEEKKGEGIDGALGNAAGALRDFTSALQGATATLHQQAR